MNLRTSDAFFDGRLQIIQPRNGYRFSIDAVLLAGAVQPKTGQTIVDLGTGCGIIPLILAYRFPGVFLYAVELQPELADLARLNVESNRMGKRISVIQGDIRQLQATAFDAPLDWIVTNPPYRRPQSGRINPNNQKALARHEIDLNLAQLIQAGRRLLRKGGCFAIIYSAERMTDLLSLMRGEGIEPKRLQCIHSLEGENAKLVLLQGVKGGRPGMTISAPMVIYRDDGRYSEMVQAMMRP